MAQIINDPGVAGSLAQSLGGVLSNSLNELADRKLQEVIKKQVHKEKTEALQGLGLDPAEASHVANLDPQFAKMYLENRGFGFQQYQPQQQDFLSQLSQPSLGNNGVSERLSPQQQLNRQLGEALSPGGVPHEPLPEFKPKPREMQLEDYLKDPRLTPAQRAKYAIDIEKIKNSKGVVSKENPSGLTPYQQTQVQEARRKSTRQENKDFNENLDKDLLNVPKVSKILDEIDGLLKKVGTFDTGYIGSKLPTSWKSKVAQRLEQEFNKLVVLESKTQGQGRGSDLLRKMVKEGKFSLEQDPAVMRDNLRELREVNDFVRDLGKARNRILKENKGEQPEDLASRVLQEVEKSNFSDYDWEHPELWEPGSVIEKDGQSYQQKNDKWVKVKKG